MSNSAPVQSTRLSADQILFRLASAVLLGKAAYRSLRFAVGDASPSMNYKGYAVVLDGVIANLSVLLIVALVVILLIALSRRGHRKVTDKVRVYSRPCPECLSLIHGAARRCAHCRSQVTPQVEQGGAST